MSDFVTTASRALELAGCARAAPATLLQRWRSFVDECTEGYGWTLYEYDAEVAVREEIETILRASELRSFPELHAFAQEVEAVDTRLRSLFTTAGVRPEKTQWWTRGILARAGLDYAQTVRDRYGIQVEQT